MKYLKLCFLACAALFVGGLRQQFCTANAEGAAGTHKHALTKLADAAWTYQHCLVMVGTDADHVNLADGAHMPTGSTDDSPAGSGSPIEVNLLGSQMGTRLLISAAAIAAEVNVYCDPANPGYIITEPAAAGTYYLVGRSKAASAETSDGIYHTEVETCQPRIVVILAALTSAQVATANATDLASSEALANALKAQYNALQADMAALVAALNAGGIYIKHL